MKTLTLSFFLVCASIAGCSSTKNNEATNGSNQEDTQHISYNLTFDADSAMKFISRQVEFGTRVPGSAGHEKCERYILRKMRQYGADTIMEQKGEVKAFNGDVLPFNNIMARFNPEAKKRILLAAHYDTRPWADNDSKLENRKKPILGANDGGSGVGVMIEVARAISKSDIPIGVDFLFVDAEDYGNSDEFGGGEGTWCLGSQYWSTHNPYSVEDRPIFGIVLDMVGGTNARFHREYFSNKLAKPIADRVWNTALKAGFDKIFINEVGGSIIDDHIYINNAGIPCIDIVECNNAVTKNFPPTWHTLNDNMAAIDKTPLKAVGTTVLHVIEEEAILE